MPSLFIKEPYKRVEFEEFKQLKIFAQKKDASSWCKSNGVKPAEISKLSTRFQDSYALNMGHNCFLMDDES